MALKINNTKGSATRQGIKILVFGVSGCGKSSIFKSTGKTILINLESGDLALNDVDVDSITVRSLADLREAYNYVANHTEEYDTVGIDSLTELSDMIVAELKSMPEYSSLKDALKMWMEFTDVILKIAKSFRDLDGINVVITALDESVKKGFDEVVVPMISGKKAQSKLVSLYDEVLYIRIGEDGDREFITNPLSDVVAKDRSGKLNPIEPYTKEEGIKPLINKIIKIKKG
jgi:energy-coupling factor transporter ATP-binding protein EcfA2